MNGNLGKALGVAAVSLLAATALRPGASDPLARVRWLTGCWVQDDGSRVIEEQWTVPRGRAMIGIGRTTERDSLTSYELVVLRARGGELHYEAHPSGQSPATFVAPGANDTLVVFANPEHDFPQQVGYRRMGHDSLLAWIAGSIGGRARRVDFRYRRAACDSP
jgi:hypothetical protein